MTLNQIIETAGNAQLTSPLSYLQGNTPGTAGFIEDMLQRMTIQPVLPFGTPKNMAGLPVSGATGLSLGNVATMVQGSPPLAGAGEENGAPALVLVVQKAPGANVLAVSHEIDAAIASLKPGPAADRVRHLAVPRRHLPELLARQPAHRADHRRAS